MPTTSTSSSRAAAAISAGDEPDPLVDDLEPGVAGGDRDLLGAVGVAVEPGLGHQQPRRSAGPLGERLGPVEHRPELVASVSDASADPGRGPVLAEHLAEGAGPLAGRAAGVGQARWWRA